MNADEAKVPNEEKDWQSIEIFLFSNGQQFSPPRKYLLRVDQLNLWDATLNQLAQSHYGLQSPLINLYTTNGHLVKGPLDLRDGQAYVAVAPPDTFVDAGYQKYLIRASRSWEKRQARMKPPECVPDEPCCLCPEKERSCCDPEACCLCPEREDTDSLEHLLPATGHPELRPAGGHYMSSAPAKPVAADDYEPVSGKIGRMTCEHCEHRENPREYGYSPVPTPGNPNGYGTRPGEYAARPGEDETRQNVNGHRPDEIGARPAEFGPRQGEYETRPSVNGAKSGEFGARPAKYGARPDDEIKPKVNGTKGSSPVPTPDHSNIYGTRPGEHAARPGEDETRQMVNGRRPDEFGARPAEYGPRQGEYETRSGVNGDKSGDFGARPANYGARPDDEIKPRVNGTKGYSSVPNPDQPNVYGTRPGEYTARPGENETRQIFNGHRLDEFAARPAEYGARQGEYETKSSVNEAKSGEYGVRPNINGGKPVEFGARPAEYGARPGDEIKPNVNGPKPGEYCARPSLNEAKPGEYGARPNEYESKPSVNGSKPAGFGARPVEYAAPPSEYGVMPGENAVRPSLNGARQGEFGARPAEYETSPKANEAKLGEYGARPGEYETRPSVNGTSHVEYKSEYRPIPGEFEKKPSVNEAKPGEYGTRRDENKIKPSVNRDNSDEVGTKPAKCKTKSRVNGAKQGENGTRQSEYESKRSVNETKPDEFLVRPVEYATRPADQENRPDDYVPGPAKYGSRTGEYGDRTTSHKARPGHSGPWSGKIEPIKEAYEIALREKEKSLKESEDRPDKDTVDKDASIKCMNDYITREVEQKDKEIESKDRSRGNGGRGGERRVSAGEKTIKKNEAVTGVGESEAKKIENARRLNGRGGAEIEQGARIGETTKIFEHGGRVGVQKARETNPAGRTSGQGARLSEQKNKQSDNLARLGGRESRVGDHEARAGDLGFHTSHDSGLENIGSREAEPGARAAVSGLRASPRDRMSSRAKTGNLGQLKIGKPGTKIDEPSVKLDDSEIKHREANPGVRQSRVGGTGTAGALHISEAQQHARRNTLSTGRPSIEKKRLSIGQNSSLPRKPPPNSSILRKSEDRQTIKTNKENLPKKINEKSSPIPVPASNDTGKSKTRPQSTALPALPPRTISITNIHTTDKDPLDNVIDEKEIIVVSTHSFKDPESETKSMRLDSVKHVVGAIDSSQEETQTELIYIEKSMAYVSVHEGVQTNTEEVEQQGQDVSTSKEKNNSCTCSLCRHPNHKAASDPDENTLSMLNKGGVVNIKLNIEVRNIVKSVYSCQKNCGRSRSLTNVPRPEKESELSIEDDVVVNRTSLQSLFTKQNFGGFGFEGSPKVMVVQCAGCGRQNTPPRCDPPPCCDSNKKYFVLLNSVLEDMEDGCNFNPPCRPCDQRQSRRQSSGIPIKQAFSETTLDTITTVTVSGVPLQRREMGKCTTNTSCQTEEPQNECMMTKRKVSITQDSVTKCDLQKKSSSSVCEATQAVSLVPKQSCLKMFSQKCDYANSQVCAELCRALCPPPACEKVRSVCSHVRSPKCEQVRPNCSQVPPPACEKVEPNCSQVSPLACENVRPNCSQVPPRTCEKVRSLCSQIPPLTCENVRPECSQVPPPTCEKVRSLYSQEPLPTCEKVRSLCSQIPPLTCENVRPECSQVPPPTCEKVRPLFPQEPLPTCEKVRSVCSHIPPPTCEKLQPDCSQVPRTICEKVRPVFSQEPLPTCEKVRSVCSQVSSQTCSQVQTKGCQPLGPQVQSRGCMPVSPICQRCCPKPPPPCLQIQTQACAPRHCDAETQTRWASILLQARLHCDGRYSFHLPPLHLLKRNCNSCCQ